METNYVEYKDANLTMQGYIARGPSSMSQPIVMVVHDWSGCREFAEEKAKYFAKQGFVGFAVDLFGKGKRGSDTDKSVNQKFMGELMEDRPLIVKRLNAALDYIKELDNVNADKIMIIGFCFGGLCALDFARSGAKVTGVVSVHGLFFKPEATSDAPITAKILAIHGYKDKMATPQLLLEFQQEMTTREADWQTHVFGKTDHAFTNPKANDPEAGLLFNSKADSRTWDLVRDFTSEIFS